MFEDSFQLPASDGTLILVRHQPAEGACRGILLIHHGLAEHSARYGAFARELAAFGFHVFAHDHRGHGGTRGPDVSPRRFAKTDGVTRVLEDCRAVHDHALKTVPGRPVIVFGHSMGGLIALNYASRHARDLAGACIWNANFDWGWEQRLGRLGLRAERALKGSDVSSALLRRATFDAWGRSIPARRTEADWLSHDPQAVDRYLADPLCGWTPSVSLAQDLLRLIEGGRSLDGLRGVPLHLLGGSEDPATDGGKAVRRLAEQTRRIGIGDVECEIVEGARHETLNEIEPLRRQAMASLLEWLGRIAPQAAGSGDGLTMTNSESSSGVST